MLKGTYLSKYRTANGTPMAIYIVRGSAKELEQFKQVQGEFYREGENQTPLFFTPMKNPNGTLKLLDSNINITITGGDRPRAIIDDGLDELNLIKQMKQLLPQAMATEYAKAQLTPTVAAPRVAVQATTQAVEAGDDLPPEEKDVVKDLESADAGTENLG